VNNRDIIYGAISVLFVGIYLTCTVTQ